MDDSILKYIIFNIKLYYPSTSTYDFDSYLNNNSLVALKHSCNDALKKLPLWIEFQNLLKDRFGQAIVLDQTLLAGNEPSFRVTLYFSQFDISLLVQLSIIVPFYSIILLTNSKIINDKRNKDFETIKTLVESNYEDYSFLSNDFLDIQLPNIKIPNIYNDSHIPTIADCIFSSRSLVSSKTSTPS